MPDALGTNWELKDVWGSGDRLGAERCLELWGPTWSWKMSGALATDLELTDA